MASSVDIVSVKRALKGAKTVALFGLAARLGDDDTLRILPEDSEDVWKEMVSSLKPGDSPASASTWLTGSGVQRLVAGALPSSCSRHNSEARPHGLTSLARSLPGGKQVAILVALESETHAFASAAAIARAFPLYSLKSGSKGPKSRVLVAFYTPDGEVKRLKRLNVVCDAVRQAARLVDMPTCELGTSEFVQEAKAVAESTGSSIKVIAGKDLDKQGFGGIWGVGKAATDPPALVILTHEPTKTGPITCWVGKGIVYDTGGLSIKPKTGMPGMKADMGGAAGVLFAFKAAVSRGYKGRLRALLCLAENAVGPDSTRPDDVLHMYSGKTVEINNTDAEGRLVLADGVAYAAKDLKADVIVDMATLTGAQLVSTGKRHAAIMTNDEDMEARVIAAGRASGDLVHPLPYCPEFFRGEFRSKIADMKNSVKSRMNAQASCAGQFVGDHLGDFKGPWLHIDMAGPAGVGDQGTGYGVALLLNLFNA